MSEEEKKISSNRQKKVDIVTDLSVKFGKAKAVVFTNYQGLTHKQIEGFKRAIKPLQAEYVVAKNSLLTIAMSENKIKLEEENTLDGQTGTLFLYDDVISPLKALAKVIKELNLPGVKFGIMENDFVTGEQVLKLSTLPTKEVLLAQLVGGLKSPIFGLHRALIWNLQKLVMTFNAISLTKPALATNAPTTSTPIEPTTTLAPASSTPIAKPEEAVSAVEAPISESEPETILAETEQEKEAEVPTETPTEEASEEKSPEEDNKGGEN